MLKRQDYYTATDKKEELYSDFLVDLNPHPQVGDIVRFVNENAVKRAIKSLIFTNRYDRIRQPNIGSGIQRILFEPITDVTSELLSTIIRETIEKYEPRCKLIDVQVIPKEEDNLYIVNIIFMVINKQDPVNLQVSLYRVR